MKKYILIGILLSLFSCSEDWMEDVVPSNKLDKEHAFETIKDARNAVNGVFSIMQSSNYWGNNFIIYGDLKGMDVRSTDLGKRGEQMYQYQETTESSAAAMWTYPYTCLVSVNNALDNLENLKTDSEKEKTEKNEILANFYALRALNHFDLLRTFARIPAAGFDKSLPGIVIADHVIEKEEQPSRATLEASYNFVISDLKKAESIMPESANTDGWFNKSAVKSLLAKVYLFNGNNQLAYDKAMEVINDSKYKLLAYDDYLKYWGSIPGNTEAILEIINTEEDNASREGVGYLWNPKGYSALTLTNKFVKEMKSNPNDVRQKAIIEESGVYSLSKYEILVNRLRIIRLSEVYFIAAEAAFKINKPDKAAELINKVIEKRTKVANKLAAKDINIKTILLEKRKEFVGEGKTFFDYMRNKLDIVRDPSDALVGALKILKYDDYRAIQPIPRIELNANPNIEQNPEYAK